MGTECEAESPTGKVLYLDTTRKISAAVQVCVANERWQNVDKMWTKYGQNVEEMWTSATGLADDLEETGSNYKLISSSVGRHVVGIYPSNCTASCRLVFIYRNIWRHVVCYLSTNLHYVMWFRIYLPKYGVL